jgi:hypothetical protein
MDLIVGLTYINSKGQVEQHPDDNDRGECARNLAGSEGLNQENENQDGAGDPNNRGVRDVRVHNGDTNLQSETILCFKINKMNSFTPELHLEWTVLE